MNFKETEWYKQFGPCEYKITLNNGQVIKSEKWRDYDKVEFNKTEFTNFNRQIKNTRFK
jgi:hypothetical protein